MIECSSLFCLQSLRIEESVQRLEGAAVGYRFAHEVFDRLLAAARTAHIIKSDDKLGGRARLDEVDAAFVATVKLQGVRIQHLQLIPATSREGVTGREIA